MILNEDFKRYSRVRDVGRWYVTRFVQDVAAALPAGTRVLDAGAGECAYKPFFNHCRYTAVDLAVGESRWTYRNLDSIATLDQLPFADAGFDAVLNTQTLEHLRRPAESVQEFYRVLRPGGTLYLSAPMAHMEHQQPYDFFRYTSFGLRELAERAGFAAGDVRVEAFGGMFTRWGYELPHALNVMPYSGIPQRQYNARGIALLPVKAVLFGFIRLTQLLLFALDRFDKKRDYPFGWSMIAVKAAH